MLVAVSKYPAKQQMVSMAFANNQKTIIQYLLILLYSRNYMGFWGLGFTKTTTCCAPLRVSKPLHEKGPGHPACPTVSYGRRRRRLQGKPNDQTDPSPFSSLRFGSLGRSGAWVPASQVQSIASLRRYNWSPRLGMLKMVKARLPQVDDVFLDW